MIEILGEKYDPYWGFEAYDPYDPFWIPDAPEDFEYERRIYGQEEIAFS